MKRTFRHLPLAALLVATAWTAAHVPLGSGSMAAAAVVQLSFAGEVDGVGYTLNGVPAPVGSPFTLDIGIDDSTAVTGRYNVESISYTLTLGTYTTVTDWATELVATQVGPTIALESDPLFDEPDEHFLLNLTGFGMASANDPRSWAGPAALIGDIIVRGVGGFASPDQLSGAFPYTGTLTLSIVPEPASLALLGVGAVALALRRRS